MAKIAIKSGYGSLIRLLVKNLVYLPVVLFLVACATKPAPVETGPIVFPKPPDAPRLFFERSIFGTGSVKPLSKSDRWRRILTGVSGREGVRFSKPFDVVVHRGRVYVSDTVQRVVMAMDFIDGQAFMIGDKDDGGDLYKPLGLAVDQSGNLFVCDGQSKKVLAYDRDGNWRFSIELEQQMSRPSGLEVNPDGSRLFVVDTGGVGSEKHRISIYDVESRTHVRSIGIRGTEGGEFNLPRDVTLGPKGLLYVTDGGNFRVQILDQEGILVGTWGSAGRHLGQFSRPKGIAAGPEGNIYVVDAAFGNFQIFSSDGDLLLFVGQRSESPGPAKYMLPAGIDVDEDGRIYMIDQFYSKLDIYRPASLGEHEGYLGIPDTEQ